MPAFITLSCPSCGGKLQLTDRIERFACSYCGQEHVVNRGGGIVSLSPVVEGMKNIQKGVDKTASELAIKRLLEEIPQIEDKLKITRFSISAKEGTKYDGVIKIIYD